MRQYMRGKGNNRSFSYRDIKKVYVIVLFEKSTAIFHQFPDSYIHYGKTRFNTGLRLDLLQEYCLIALDVFRKIATVYKGNNIKINNGLPILRRDTAQTRLRAVFL